MNWLAIGLTFLCMQTATAGLTPPTFGRAFTPATIGPGSTTTLAFTIDNGNTGAPVSDLAFTNTLPASVVIATGGIVQSTCGGVLSAPDAGSTISLSGGIVAAFGSCRIDVDVTSSTPGTHTNVSGDLNSSAGNSGNAAADLMVVTTRPGFSKSFAPGSVALGGTATLAFTIDNSANAADLGQLSFSDTLPAGLRIASPANATTDCGNPSVPAVINAASGGNSIVFQADGFLPSFPTLAAGAACTVSLDVLADGSVLRNRSGELLVAGVSAGRATDSLQVTTTTLALIKSFDGDPVAPGGVVQLRFRIQNLDRNDAATSIAFTDDLDATLSGLQTTGTPLTNPCGVGSTLSGSSLLAFTGGSLAPEASCEFSVTVQVPAGAAPGSYPNTTSAITGTVGGSPVTGNVASNTLHVQPVPVLTITNLSGTLTAGDSFTLQFDIQNGSTTDSATDMSFRLAHPTLGTASVSMLPSPGFCGAGSSAGVAQVAGVDFTTIDGANLAAGASCTLSVDYTLPSNAPSGSYCETSSDITATVAGSTFSAPGDSVSIDVVAAPTLVHEYVGVAQAGGTVILRYTLTHGLNSPANATAIAFDHDLDATLSGLTAIGLPANGFCGAGSSITGTAQLAMAGGTLAPGASCSFDVSLQIPAAATGGNYPSTTSGVSANVGAFMGATAAPSVATLTVTSLTLTQSFTDDPAFPGSLVTLEFSLSNLSGTDLIDNIVFTENLNSALSGLSAVGLPASNVCGAGSQISGTTNLVFTGGSLAAGASCTFQVTLQVPAGATPGTYAAVTSNVTADQAGSPIVAGGASDQLVVAALEFDKSFTDDPAAAGGTVTLEYTINNPGGSGSATAIAFNDDLDAALAGLAATGLPLTDMCGAGSTLGGTSTITLTGGTLAAGSSCTFSVTLLVPGTASAGSYASASTQLSAVVGGVPVSAPPASDLLQIVAASFSATVQSTTSPGGSTDMSYTISNLGGSTLSDLGFSINLGAGLAGLSASGLPQSGICGAGSSLSGTSTVIAQGMSIPAGGSCTFSFTLQVPGGASPGNYPLTSSALTSAGLFIAAPATATLVVAGLPTFGKAFAPATIGSGGTSMLTFSIDNSASSSAVAGLAFTDNFPAGMLVATPSNAATTCTGGTLTAVAGTAAVDYSGGSVAAGATCTLSVDVTAAAAGSYPNTSSVLSTAIGPSNAASATLQVSDAPIAFGKTIAPATVLPGGFITVTYTLQNGSATLGYTGIGFSDDFGGVIAGAAATGLPMADVCGAGSQLAGTGVVTLTGGTLAAGTQCQFSVQVRLPGTATAATYTSTSGPVTANASGGGSVNGAGASAGFSVAFLGFTKTMPTQATAGDLVNVTFAITNPDAANAATAIGFSDDLNAFVPGAVAEGLPLANACGAGSTVSGTSTVSLAGGNIAAGGSCSFIVPVRIPASATAGSYINRTSALQAQVGGTAVNGGAASIASATLGLGGGTPVGPVVIPATDLLALLALGGLMLMLGMLAVQRRD